MERFIYLDSKDWGAQQDGTYINPVVWEDYNNPFIMQHETGFYMVAASHHFMGMPALHSTDLVNWRLCSRVYFSLDFDDKYNHPGQAYQKGSWAPSLVCHGGRFMVYCMNSVDGLFVSAATDMKGPWSPVKLIHKASHWEDPFPFWDEDGQAYLIHSGFGPSPLMLHKMSPDGMKILDDGVILQETYPSVHNPIIKKRFGYYFIFGMGHGKDDIRGEYVFRSKNIYGPYEEKRILTAGGEGCSPGGGGWAELPDGSSWFMHHVGVSGYGRLPFLEPAGWKNGWPWIGKGEGDGAAGGVVFKHKTPFKNTPARGKRFARTDDFSSPGLDLAWRWNHNPKNELWSLCERPGYLRLKAGCLEKESGISGIHEQIAAADDCILFANNILSQLAIGPRCKATTQLDIHNMQDGQRAGFCFFNKSYAWVGVVQERGKKHVRAYCMGAEKVVIFDGPSDIKENTIWLRGECTEGIGSLFYSLDGASFIQLGSPLAFKTEWFESHSLSLFTYNVNSQIGYVDFKSFCISR